MKESGPGSHRSAALRNINILLLDSDPRMLVVVRNVLSDLGFHNIFTGRNGKEGLDVMENERIQMVITDWDMRPIDGIAFIRTVRNTPNAATRVVPIILLTARAEAEDVKTARDAGITEFVAKPFTVKRLVERIVAIVDNPRSFVLAPNFKGHDRRRKDGPPEGGVEKRKRRK